MFFTILGYSQQQIQGSFQSEICTKFEYHYLISKPKNTKDKIPLIIFLHGSGERGTNLELLKIHGPLKYIQTNTLDCIILAPQCPEGQLWNTEQLYQLIQKTCSENSIDTSRIYLTGLSMGAWGAWNLAYSHPELFAAVVPIAGFVDRIPMMDPCKFKGIPIRLYHGLLDNVVDIYYSISIYKKIKECDSNIEFQIFSDANHDSWSRVYDSDEIYSWMLLQSRK
jgi:predicted peptidase